MAHVGSALRTVLARRKTVRRADPTKADVCNPDGNRCRMVGLAALDTTLHVFVWKIRLVLFLGDQRGIIWRWLAPMIMVETGHFEDAHGDEPDEILRFHHRSRLSDLGE
jgi:hypothetical protein